MGGSPIGLSRRALLAGGLALPSTVARGQTRGAGRPLRISATFTILQDIARSIAGPGVEVASVVQIGAEVHEYQPTQADILHAQASDLVLWNGLGLERWFERFFGNVRAVPQAAASEGIVPITLTEGPYSGRPNPHAWMSPTNGLVYADNIRRALIDVDPAGSRVYNRNAEAYRDRLRALDDFMRTSLAPLAAERKWLVTSEGALSYLARDYGFQDASLWPLNSDEQGTKRQIARLVEIVRQNRIAVVFSETTVSDRPIREVARLAGARYGGALSVDSLTGPRGGAATYPDLLRGTTETIVRAMSQS